MSKFMDWFLKEIDKAWTRCRKSKNINKIGFFASKKSCFRIGMSEGWSLALDTDEGYKWMKINYEARRKKREK